MPLEVIQWHWNWSQNPFQTIASYQPAQQQLKDVRGVSWHTPDGTVSSQGPGQGLCQNGQGPFYQGGHPRFMSRSSWGSLFVGVLSGVLSLHQ